MGLLTKPWVQRMFGGGFLERLGVNFTAWVHLRFLGTHKDKDLIRLLRRVRKERASLLTGNETFFIYALARAHSHLPGAMAEVGVFQGVSAKLICEAKGNTTLHLFDTFTGLPPATAADRSGHRPNQYAASLESVQAYLQGYPNVHFHKGLFPDSAREVEELTYSFVHIDVDLYASTKACLEYFYPRLMAGGVLISHDYSLLPGVKQAFEEFLNDKRERVIEVPTTQCMLVKL
jgi:O-methyltransferase